MFHVDVLFQNQNPGFFSIVNIWKLEKASHTFILNKSSKKNVSTISSEEQQVCFGKPLKQNCEQRMHLFAATRLVWFAIRNWRVIATHDGARERV